MQELAKVDDKRRLWLAAAIPFAAPTDTQLFRWERFSDEIYAHGIRRLAAKCRAGQIKSQSDAERYLTGVMLSEERQRGGRVG